MPLNIIRSNVSSIFANVVRQHDYETYLATIFMEKTLQPPVFALRAFDTELSRIPIETVDPHAAANKIKFWQEAIHDIYDTEINLALVHNNPIVQELFKVCCSYPIHRNYLENLVTSRDYLLTSNFFQTYDDLEYYAENTDSSIYHAILAIAGVIDKNANHVAQNLGKAQGITRILRSTDAYTTHRCMLLPNDMVTHYNVKTEEVLRGDGDSDSFRGLVSELAYKANSFLAEARHVDIPKRSSQIFLPAVAVHKYLKSLKKCNYNIFDKSLRYFTSLPFHLYLIKFIHKF